MKNKTKLFTAIVLAAAVVFITASCATLGGSSKQTIIAITGIDAQYNDMFAITGLTGASGAAIVAGLPRKINNGQITCEMFELNGNEALRKGTYSVIIRISENSAMNGQTEFVYNGKAASQKIANGKNIMAFEKFIRVE